MDAGVLCVARFFLCTLDARCCCSAVGSNCRVLDAGHRGHVCLPYAALGPSPNAEPNWAEAASVDVGV